MKKLIAATIGLLVASGCGSSADSAANAGAKACKIYQAEMADSPEAITSMFVMPKIKDMLPDLDAPTRRAFAALITAADANMFSEAAASADEKAAEVRSVCLAEHSVEIAN